MILLVKRVHVALWHVIAGPSSRGSMMRLIISGSGYGKGTLAFVEVS